MALINSFAAHLHALDDRSEHAVRNRLGACNDGFALEATLFHMLIDSLLGSIFARGDNYAPLPWWLVVRSFLLCRTSKDKTSVGQQML